MNDSSTGQLKEHIDKVVYYILVVFLVALLTLLFAIVAPIIDAWRFRASTYQDLINKVNDSNTKVDELKKEIHEQRDEQAQILKDIKRSQQTNGINK